jgi:urease accessory protein UreE
MFNIDGVDLEREIEAQNKKNQLHTMNPENNLDIKLMAKNRALRDGDVLMYEQIENFIYSTSYLKGIALHTDSF